MSGAAGAFFSVATRRTTAHRFAYVEPVESGEALMGPELTGVGLDGVGAGSAALGGAEGSLPDRFAVAVFFFAAIAAAR